MRSGPARLIISLGILALSAASCASPEEPAATRSPEAAPAATSPAAPTSPPPTEEPAEDPPVPGELRFTAPALGGGTIDGAEYAGSDLVIWFWAPW
ncbi:MAG TPA: hypothetical protein VF058_07340 [Actinomycetota bacterium]